MSYARSHTLGAAVLVALSGAAIEPVVPSTAPSAHATAHAAAPSAAQPFSHTSALAAQSSETRASAHPRDPVATTERFALWSSPRVSLHHFLIAWASVERGIWPRYAEPVIERDEIDRLSSDERAVWAEAVSAYEAGTGRSHVFDEGLIALRDWAAGVGSLDGLSSRDQALAQALERALPIYQAYWWTEHDRTNRAWIETAAELVRRTERDIVMRIEEAYGATWPTGLIPIDAVPYANDVGAYSTAGRLTLASADPDNAAPQSLELVFHEASHVDPLEIPLRTVLSEAFEAEGGEAPDRLWHDLIFFTTGEITAIALEDRDQEYQHYGHATGLYRRGERWALQLPALERHWRSFLRSDDRTSESRTMALREVARSLLDAAEASRPNYAGGSP